MAQIRVEELRKTYRIAQGGFFSRRFRTVDALAGISFAAERGELLGYIGPNGAGKSTTVKILAGILVPDSGRVEIDGRVPWRERVAHVAGIGVVFGQRTQLWWDLPVEDSFSLLKAVYRIDPAAFRRSHEELVEGLALRELLRVPVRQLSLGQRMRCELAASLLHAPGILFLDEPTIGLDAVSKLAVRGFIQRLNRERGVTVILTTHDLDDIEALAGRVLVIADGTIVLDGPIAALRAQVTRERRLVIDLVDPDAPVSDPDAEVVSREGDRVVMAFDPERISAADLIRRLTARIAVRDFLVHDPPIEEIVARFYAGGKGTGAKSPPGAQAAATGKTR